MYYSFRLVTSSYHFFAVNSSTAQQKDKDSARYHGKETAYYTGGDELLSMERDGRVWYYLYDGHGDVRTLTDEAGQVDQIEEAIKSGDTMETAVRIVQLVCMLFALTSQCFTGDTLVSTADGLCPIEEIVAGDYVWSENTETGETELKEVLSVSVTETDKLVHVFTEDGNGTNIEINTTENHPFYVEGKGWVPASELQSGDTLHTQDGRMETVSDVETEQLEEAVRVYNLEIEDSHTYYVSVDGVLVHNECSKDITKTINNNTGKDCEDVSQLVKQSILENGEHGELVKITTGLSDDYFGRIFNDVRNKLVVTNGYHFGVKYDGKMYDEYFPEGIDFDS